MNSDIKLGQVWGIPIGLNASWFLIFTLITFSLSAGLFPQAFPGISGVVTLVVGALTAILFFGSVLLHELGHAYAAQRSGIRVRAITLFMFGGVAQLEQDSRTPGEEFRIAAAGPLVSFALAALFAIVSTLGGVSLLGVMAGWLAGVNLSLALFNLIPGYPLDGGRLLKAFVWWRTGDQHRATRIAATGGRWVAWGFIGFGAFEILLGAFFNGLWLIIIGWFLKNAADQTFTMSRVQQTLTGMRVSDVMSRGWSLINGLTPLQEVIDQYAMRTGERAFVIRDEDRLAGILTLNDLVRVPRNVWRYTVARQVMTPWERVLRVQPDTDLMAALRTMDEARVQQIPVEQNEEIVGMLTREAALRHLQMRMRFG
jgi:Zn-dependent protease/CBS domain-containing protein